MIRILLIAIVLSSSAAAQIAIPAAPREFIVDAVVEAAHVDSDTIPLFVLPARAAVTAVYVISEGDSMWTASGSALVRFESPDATQLVMWTPESAGLLDCYGCLAADWSPGTGAIAYRKQRTMIVLDLVGPTGDHRGRLRIIIRYIELI